MPTTVTSTSGEIYHVFQPTTSVKDMTASIEFSELENQLGDSYFTQRLIGSDTGNRSWLITLPSLTNSTDANALVTGANGESTTKERYIWDLFTECKVTGKPFAYQDGENGQYYLVDFADRKLSMQRMYAYLHSTGIELKQRRLNGETVYEPSLLSDYNGSAANERYDETTHNSPSWRQVFYSGLSSAPQWDTDGCTFAANPQNGHNVVRFTTSGYADHYKLGGYNSVTIYDMFIVLKIREATFTGTPYVLHNVSAAASYLRGTNGTALFANPSLSNFEYRLNGIEYAQTAMAAPMNAWGVVHLRFTAGKTFSQMRLGHSGAGGALMDIGEVRLTNSLRPFYEIREFVEHLSIKWAVGG